MNALDLYIECSNLTVHTNGPSFIRVRVDSEFLSMATRRSNFCIAEKLKNTNQVLSPASWDTSNTEISYWELMVNTEYLWFQGREYDDDEVLSESHGISIDLLRNRVFGRSYDLSISGEPMMCSIGGCILYSDYELDKFTVTILNKCPEVAAKKLELEMAERITQSLTPADNAPISVLDANENPRRRCKV